MQRQPLNLLFGIFRLREEQVCKPEADPVRLRATVLGTKLSTGFSPARRSDPPSIRFRIPVQKAQIAYSTPTGTCGFCFRPGRL